MNPALNTAATGMSAQQTRTDVIANNLANVDTTSFKSSRPNFVDLLYQTVQNQQTVGTGDASTTPAIQVGRGTRLVGIERVQSQGALTQTSSPTDLGINGEGYFQVQQANGTISYTRDGSFQISDQGALVTSDGLTVVPGIKIPANSSNLTVSSNGIVTVTQPGATTTTELGRIELANFANPAGLLALGREPVPADAGFRRSGHRLSGRRGRGHAPAGIPRGEQRGHRAGNGEHDRRPARVRDQLEGDLEQRHDDGHRQQPAPVMNRLRLASLSGIAVAALAIAASPARAQRAAPVAARDIPRGTELTAADIAADSGSANAPLSLIGWVARRVIHEGEALREPAIDSPRLVRAGADVTVRAELGGVVVTRPGTALMAGSLGERVRVRIDSEHFVTGIVAAPATVRIQ